MSKTVMLDEYFSMRITPDGKLESLPLLLRGYAPDLSRLPLFLMRLGPQVQWTQERECLSSFLRELAYFYAPYPLLPSSSSKSKSSTDAGVGEDESEAATKAEKWQIEHVLFACMRRNLIPPRNLLDRDVVQVASLPDLYRVFERC